MNFFSLNMYVLYFAALLYPAIAALASLVYLLRMQFLKLALDPNF